MSKINQIMYWSPSLVNIATNKAVFNSALSLKKFKKKDVYDCSLINFFGEFDRFQEIADENKINFINFFSKRLSKYLPRHGKIRSRFSFVLIFIFSFIPLKNLLNKRKPDFFIIHLLTSLPLVLLIIFNFQSKFILRISGLPKLNFFRKYLWKIAFKKIHSVTCPTKNTRDLIKSLNIIDPDKIKLLYDPIIEVNKYSSRRIIEDKNFTFQKEKYYLAIGRLTRQKNFLFLCNCFKKILLKKPDEKLLIAGEGEDYNKINKYIKHNKLEKNIFLLGYKKNILTFLKNSKGLILTSLWEDPGFVLIEAAMSKTFVLSSNCFNGPNELIKDDENGILFESNNKINFEEKFNIFSKLDKNENKNILLNNLKVAKNFTLFNHFKALDNILINKKCF